MDLDNRYHSHAFELLHVSIFKYNINMALICEGCSDTVADIEAMACTQCPRRYHYACLGVSKTNFEKQRKAFKANWKCPVCLNSQRKGGDNSNTPIRCADPSGPRCETSLDHKFDAFKQELLDKLASEFASLRTELSAVHDLQTSVDFMSAQYDDLKKIIETQNEIIKNLKFDKDQLASTVSVLQSRLNNIEQMSRDCNVEVQCVPEHRSENIVQTVIQMASVISLPLHESEIQACHRVAKMNKDSRRPRSIIIKLPNVRRRDDLLAAVQKFNKLHPGDKLNSSHLGIGGDKQPVFLTEHLSPANKALHAATRIEARKMNFKFVWIRNGKIYIRKNETSPPHLISSIETLSKLQSWESHDA